MLSEEESAELSDCLLQVEKGMVISIRYFKEDTEHPAIPPLGTYETVNGKVEMIDWCGIKKVDSLFSRIS